MEKQFLSFSLCALLISGTGCVKSEPARKIDDGVYTAVSSGYQSDISLSVTFEGGKITDITVDEQNETRTLTDSAFKKVPQYIKDTQSVQVDVSTGATVTSKAIMKCVEQAITNANGDLSEWKDDYTGKHAAKEVDKHIPVVIAGGGAAGLAASLRLQELSVNTMVIEKSSVLGGTLALSDGYTQLFADETADEDTLKEFLQAEEDGRKELLADYLIDTETWQNDVLGITFREEEPDSSLQNYNASYASNTGELIGKESEVSGAEILKQTCVYDVLKEDDDIVGVKAKAKNGTIYNVYADDIIIASGSYPNFNEMESYAGSPYNSGDLLKVFEVVPKDTYQTTSFAIQLEDRAIDLACLIEKYEDEEIALLDGNGETIDLVNQSERSSLASAEENLTLVVEESVLQKMSKDLVEMYPVLKAEIKDYIEQVKELYESDACASLFAEESGAAGSTQHYYQLPLVKGVRRGCGGLKTDGSLHLKIGRQVYENVYVIGSAAEILDANIEGIENAWAFVSGKYVADTIAQKE